MEVFGDSRVFIEYSLYPRPCKVLGCRVMDRPDFNPYKTYILMGETEKKEISSEITNNTSC